MPINSKELEDALVRMKGLYVADPDGAVRSKEFINTFQKYCALELSRSVRTQKLKKMDINTDIHLLTPYSTKSVDVVCTMEYNGPVIAISAKSQMSSAMKNIIHYYEGAVGDVTSLHKRFPFLSAGMIWLFPLRPIKGGKEKEVVNFQKVERLFTMASGRRDTSSEYDKYEYFSMIVVDFEQDPPLVSNVFPRDANLRMDGFFDDLSRLFVERTPSVDSNSKNP